MERRGVMDAVFKALNDGTGPRLVGLVGQSGSGKTTAASDIVRSTEVREAFSDGIVWLTVNNDANGCFSSLMLQLARTVFEDIGGSVGSAPRECDDGGAYVKQRMMRGSGGRRLKCLVVADNVWEKEVVSKLLETGMWVLLSTRDEGLVTDADGEAVGVDELSKADAESVLRRAAELAPGVRLPDDAVGLIELCGRVAMDLAFVGRWSTVRGRQDREAWADAVGKVRAEMSKVVGGPENDTAENTRTTRRKAILRAGFEDLAIGSDDERVQRLYLSLAVLPNGYAFAVKDAAVLLYDRTPNAEDEASVAGVVETLERWSVLRSVEAWIPGGVSFQMHDAHSSFAREIILDRRRVLRLALARWTKYISSLSALLSVRWHHLKALWLTVGQMGGNKLENSRPYAAALAGMEDSDPLLWESMKAVARFQQEVEDWEGASETCHRMRQVGETKIGEKENDVDSPCSPYSVQDLAFHFRKTGRLKEAEGMFRLDMQLKEAKLGPEDMEVAHTLHQLGMCVREAGRLEESEKILGRCVGILDAKLAGPEGVHCTLQKFGLWSRTIGRLEEGEELLRRCLLIKETKLGKEDAEVGHTLYWLGICIREAGRLKEAEGLLRRSLDIREATLGPEDVHVAYTLCSLGVCVRDAGRLEEAEALLRRCLAIEEAKLGREDEQVARTLLSLGICLQKADRLDEAEELLKRCLQIREAKLSPKDALVADALHHLGVLFRETNRLNEAEILFRRCLAIQEAADRVGQPYVPVDDTLRELDRCI